MPGLAVTRVREINLPPRSGFAAPHLTVKLFDDERPPGAKVCKQACTMASGSSPSQKSRHKLPAYVYISIQAQAALHHTINMMTVMQLLTAYPAIRLPVVRKASARCPFHAPCQDIRPWGRPCTIPDINEHVLIQKAPLLNLCYPITTKVTCQLFSQFRDCILSLSDPAKMYMLKAVWSHPDSKCNPHMVPDPAAV